MLFKWKNYVYLVLIYYSNTQLTSGKFVLFLFTPYKAF
ncbi:hypothetical protein CHCC15075_1394 [Bacillus licheniformis]|nr:hypothetical protein CHCC15075_1394 [Bacillus licheniformis]TWM56779.1 hypothetical protein CHCC14815_0935 [Bacillus licheniformis]TWN03829.1 hypothetical protein CHCC14566_2294 [Bacillus licheniformis]TWN19926.1 hypothetical protein CHCC14562_0726 [Bacillus licheniformis]